MILDTVTKSAEIKLGEATITTECDITADYVDITESTFSPASNDTVTSGTTAVTAVAAAGIGVVRQVKEILVNNRDTVAHNIILQLNNGGTVRRKLLKSVAANASFIYRPDALQGPDGTAGIDGAPGAPAGAAGTPADFGFYFEGNVGTSQQIMYMVQTRAIDLPINLSGSQFSCKIAPTADYTVTFYQNGASIGSVKFTASTGVPVITFSAGIGLSPGDTFELRGQTSADATIKDISFGFLATFA
jgi:hypothetical protein